MLFKSRISHFLQLKFVRNVMLLQAGSFGANVFRALINVFLARLLQPELFGIYALAFSMAEFMMTIFGFGAQEAVTTVVSAAYARGDREETKEALAFLLKIIAIVAVALILVSFLLPAITVRLYDSREIGIYASIVIIASLISMTFFSVTSLGLQVAGKIGTLAGLTFLDQVVRFGAGLMLVYYGFGVFGAMSGHIFGALLVAGISIFLWHRLQQQYHIFPHFRDLLRRTFSVSIRKYLRFSFWITADKNVASLFGSLPILLTGLYLSATEVSYLRLAQSYLNLILSLLVPVSVLLNVEFPKLRVNNPRGLLRRFLTVTLFGLGISALLTVGAQIVAPVAIKILYGEAFLPGIAYIRGLSMYAALFGLGVALGAIWRALDRVQTSLAINFGILAVGIPLGLYLIQYFGLKGAVITMTVWYTASHGISFFYAVKKLRAIDSVT